MSSVIQPRKQEDPLGIIIDSQRALLTDPLKRLLEVTNVTPDLGKRGIRVGKGPVKRLQSFEPISAGRLPHEIPYGSLSVLTDSKDISSDQLWEEMSNPGIRTSFQFLGNPFQSPIFHLEQKIIPMKNNPDQTQSTTTVFLKKIDDNVREKGFMKLGVYSQQNIERLTLMSDVSYSTLDGHCENIKLRFYFDGVVGSVGIDYRSRKDSVELDTIHIRSGNNSSVRDMWAKPTNESIKEGKINLEFECLGLSNKFSTPHKIDTEAEIYRMMQMMEHGFKYKK